MIKSIYIVDDQKEIRDLLKGFFKKSGYNTITFASADALFKRLKKPNESVIILDYDFGNNNETGLQILKKLKEKYSDIFVIILTGKGTIDMAVKAMKLGAADFVEKDIHLKQYLGISIEKLNNLLKIIEENKGLKEQTVMLLNEKQYLKERVEEEYSMVGRTNKFQEMIKKLKKVADIPRPVLITGERGTGKELAAAFLHKYSVRKDKPFITLNCAAVPEGLMECELFGQEENAFTGAKFKRGRFELAHRGTLFLDEIGNMPIEFQKRFLRVIEYQKFERVGGENTLKVDVRIVAATNSDLKGMIKTGKFRADLYDRIAFEIIDIPPLRMRKGDIKSLTYYFIDKMLKEVPNLKKKTFTSEAIKELERYKWPGNIRELRYLIERITYKYDTEIIGKNIIMTEII